MKETKLKKQKGITLIALIITIIVMLILVTVSITLAINGDLFNKAGEATRETGEKTAAENELSEQSTSTINLHVAEATGDKYGALQAYENIEKDANNYLTKNAKYTTGSDTAVIPAGFKVSTAASEQTISTGLVIQDSSGNEFVWIPVNYTVTNRDENSNGYDDGFDATFYRSEWADNARGTSLSESSDYVEPFEGGYAGEVEEYNLMLESVYTYRGFYIGRYEAGSTTPRTNPTTANGTTTMVIKRDVYPYNYVAWGITIDDYTSEIMYNGYNQGNGAVYLCKQLYQDSTSVTSTLCYGIQWDAALDFIRDTNNVTNGQLVSNSSVRWGNNKDSAYTTTSTSSYNILVTPNFQGWTTGSYIKSSGTMCLLTTGASEQFKAKNIYDMEGNVGEWTNEAYIPSDGRAIRGGTFGGDVANSSIGVRYGGPRPVAHNSYVGFRPTVYIK